MKNILMIFVSIFYSIFATIEFIEQHYLGSWFAITTLFFHLMWLHENYKRVEETEK